MFYLLIGKANWNFSDLYKFPVKKRDWIFKIFADEVEKLGQDEPTGTS